MVARPPVRIRIEAMSLDDLPAVQAIEEASFTTPWPPNAYRSELEMNRLATYLVARAEGEVVAYAGIWMMVDEAHITTFAVDPRWRRQGIGERLLLALLDMAIGRRARESAPGWMLTAARSSAPCSVSQIGRHLRRIGWSNSTQPKLAIPR